MWLYIASNSGPSSVKHRIGVTLTTRNEWAANTRPSAKSWNLAIWRSCLPRIRVCSQVKWLRDPIVGEREVHAAYEF